MRHIALGVPEQPSEKKRLKKMGMIESRIIIEKKDGYL